MSRHTTTAAVASATLALLLAGCAAYDYHQHSDRISFRAGDAVKANLERETTNPSHGSSYDTTGLGANGAVVPKEDKPQG